MREVGVKIVTGFLIAVLTVGVVLGADASNPYVGTIKWDIPTDTSFSVSFSGGETQINFIATTKNDTLLEPSGQDASADTPILTITNEGDTNLNFTCNLTDAVPSWATIKVSNTSDHTNAYEFSNGAPAIINASVPPSQSTKMFLWTNLTNAEAGNTTRTLKIYSAVA